MKDITNSSSFFKGRSSASVPTRPGTQAVHWLIGAMIQRTIRSTLLTLSSFAAAAPIEVITATFIIVTLTYFQLLQAIKGSEFFQVPPQISPPPKPIQFVRLSHPSVAHQPDDDSPFLLPSSSSSFVLNTFTNSNTWAPLPASEFRKVLEATALEGGYIFSPDVGGNNQGEAADVVIVKQLNLVKDDGEDVSDKWVDWLLNDVGVETGGRKFTYQDLCFQCNITLTPHPLHPTHSTITLFLKPPSPEIPTLAYLNHLSRIPPFSPTGSNTTFRLLTAPSPTWGFLPSFDGAGLFPAFGDSLSSDKEAEDLLSGLRNVRWFAYAARAFVMRFYTLALVRLAYILGR